MRAVLYEEFRGPITVQDVPDPTPRDDGVVVEVKATGICRSDWHGWMGHDKDIHLPHVPGHELAGDIVAVGKDVRRLKVGDRVTVPFVSGCGQCPPCSRGDPQVCDAQFQPGFTHWGSFARYVGLHYADRNVVHLPESLSHVSAASLGCRFVTAYRAIVQLAALRQGETIVVFGCGGVGTSSISIAKGLGARSIAVDVDPSKLEFARSLGADHTLDAAKDPDVAAHVVELTHGGADVSIDALGSTTTLKQSLRSLRKRGRHVQVGLMVGDDSRPPVPMGRVIAHELTLYGSHGIAAASYPEVFDFIAKRGVPLDRLVGPRLTLDEAPAHLAAMGSYKGIGMAIVDPAPARSSSRG